MKTTTKDANACRLDALKTAEVGLFFKILVLKIMKNENSNKGC